MISYHMVRSIGLLIACLLIFFDDSRNAQAQRPLVAVISPLPGQQTNHLAEVMAGANAVAEVSQRTPLPLMRAGVDVVLFNETCLKDDDNLIGYQVVTLQASAAVGFVCPSSLVKAMPELEKAEIPVITLSATAFAAAKRTNPESKMLFSLQPRQMNFGEIFAKYIAARWAQNRFAIAGRYSAAIDDLVKNLENQGISPGFVTTSDASPASIDALLDELDRKNLNFLFLVDKQASVSLIGTEIEKRKMKISIAVGFPVMLSMGNTSLANGTRAVVPMSPFVPQILPVSTRKLVLPNYVFLSDAAGTVVAEALSIARSQNRRIAEVLETTIFQSKLGPVKFDSEHRRELVPYEEFEWRNGEWVDVPQ